MSTTAEDVLHALAGDVRCDFCLEWYTKHSSLGPLPLGLSAIFNKAPTTWDRWRACLFCEEKVVDNFRDEYRDEYYATQE